MKIRRRTEITILTEKLVSVTESGSDSRAARKCLECGTAVQMLPADEAAKIAAVAVRVIYRLVEAGKLHSLETPDGSLLICPISLGEIEAE